MESRRVVDLLAVLAMGIIDSGLSRLLAGEAVIDGHLLSIFDDLHIGIALLDRELRYRYLNQTARAATLRSLGDPLGQPVVELMRSAYGEDASERFHAICQQVLADGEPHHERSWDLAQRRLEPREAWIDWSLYRLREGPEAEAAGLLLTVTDVTEHVRMHQAIERQQRLLRTVVDSVPGLVAYVDREQRYVVANQAYRELVGRDPEAIVGRRVAEVLGAESYAKVGSLIERALAGEAVRYEQELTLEGQPPRVLAGAYIPVRDAAGVVEGFVGLVQDFTERHRLQQRLERQNEELEQFAGLAAHDIQAPLRLVSIQAELLGEDLTGSLSAEHRESFDRLHLGLQRMRAVVLALLAYARSGAGDVAMGPLPLRQPLEAALANLAEAIAEREAEVVVPEDLPTVHGEATLLAQVFQNLLGNGIKFCERRPRLVVEHRESGHEHEIRIHDNGIGLEPEQIDRLFRTFSRLHGNGYPGTGLGLASCRKIVELHGGRVWAESRLGEGSTFGFTLLKNVASE